jgi:hypothetical protein
LGGGSAGARCALLAAAYRPETVSRLALWWVSGGVISLMTLGANYYGESAAAAALGGMAAVAEAPAWAEQIRRNPRNREILLAQDPERFVAVMERWAAAFIPSPASPVPGLAAKDFDRLIMPVLIFRGNPRDIYHPPKAGEAVATRIPHAVLADPPWTEAAATERMLAARRTGTGHFLDWPRLAPAIAQFIDR